MNVETFVADNFSAQTITVGSSAVQLFSTPTPSSYGVLIKALTGNSGTVDVGKSDVTSGAGFSLSAGQEIWLQVDHLETIWVIGSGSGQKVSILAYK